MHWLYPMHPFLIAYDNLGTGNGATEDKHPWSTTFFVTYGSICHRCGTLVPWKQLEPSSLTAYFVEAGSAAKISILINFFFLAHSNLILVLSFSLRELVNECQNEVCMHYT